MAELAEMEAQHRFKKSTPLLSKLLGVPEEEIARAGPEGLGALLEFYKAAPAPQKPSPYGFREFGAETEEGQPGKQKYITDPEAGAMIPYGDVTPTGTPRTSMRIPLPDGGVFEFDTGTYFGGAGTGQARREREIRDHAESGWRSVSVMLPLIRQLEAGGTMEGVIGNFATRLAGVASSLSQTGAAMMGQEEFGKMVEGHADLPTPFKAAMKSNKELAAGYRYVAYILARHLNPNARSIGPGVMGEVLKTLGQSADPSLSATVLRRHIETIIGDVQRNSASLPTGAIDLRKRLSPEDLKLLTGAGVDMPPGLPPIPPGLKVRSIERID
jgi:hypothetical protein